MEYYKIGQRVRFISNNYNNLAYGSEGKVVSYWNSDPKLGYDIKWYKGYLSTMDVGRGIGYFSCSDKSIEPIKRTGKYLDGRRQW